MRHLNRAGSLMLAAFICVGGAVTAFTDDATPNMDAIAPDFTAEPRPDDVAVVIGIEKYRDISAPVEYASSDAQLVSEYLLALGFLPQNIRMLRDERATGKDIERALEKWLPNQVKPTSKVFIYYSGHGTPDPVKEEPYLLPHDGDPSYIEDAYPLKKLYAGLSQLKAAEVVVVIDACFSGTGGRSVAPPGRPLANIFMPQERGLLLPAHLAIITASEAKQTSNASPQNKHGIFTYHFLKAIKDGHQTLGDIFKTIKPEVAKEAFRLNFKQSPTLTPELEKIGSNFRIANFKRVEKPKEAVVNKEEEARQKQEWASKLRELEEKQRELDKAAKIQEEKDRQSERERQRLTEQAERDRRSAEAERERAEAERRSAEQEGRKVRKKVTITPTF